MEDIEIESLGVKAGINPMFGRWHHKFLIEPVSYSNTRISKDQFKKRVQSDFDNKYVFCGEVKALITLYLNELKMLENPEYGDLDNYAKQILDTLKGNGGILIDDCQVQSLTISWIDVTGDSYFEVEIESRPDEFMQLPLKLYEMPDKRYYPLSRNGWTKDGVVEIPEDALSHLLVALKESTSRVKQYKHQLRQSGNAPLAAYRATMPLLPLLMGFHKSAIVDSGFEAIDHKVWSNDV